MQKDNGWESLQTDQVKTDQDGSSITFLTLSLDFSLTNDLSD